MARDFYRRNDCRLCGSRDLELVLALVPTPPANNFLKSTQLDDPEEKYPLDVFFCKSCAHVQLLDVVNPEILFRNYVYVSGTSPVFVKHFQKYAETVVGWLENQQQPFIVDIGSNDGTLLRQFQNLGARVLGVDPARAIAEKASQEGVPTWGDFFSSALAEKIKQQCGEADAVVANNVFAHIDNLHNIVDGVKKILSPRGVFVFEVSYLLDVCEKTLFDTIYHEHLDYHSVIPLIRFFQSHGMQLVHTERVSSHGGSLRAYVQWAEGPRKINASVNAFVEEEKLAGLDCPERLKTLGRQIDALKHELMRVLGDLKSKGKKIAAFGAPAKATTLMHHFGLSRDWIEFVIDDSPLKQGLYSPGLHVPVLARDALQREKPDYLVILAWNFADAIIQSNKDFLNSGGHFIVPVPQVRLV